MKDSARYHLFEYLPAFFEGFAARSFSAETEAGLQEAPWLASWRADPLFVGFRTSGGWLSAHLKDGRAYAVGRIEVK